MMKNVGNDGAEDRRLDDASSIGRNCRNDRSRGNLYVIGLGPLLRCSR